MFQAWVDGHYALKAMKRGARRQWLDSSFQTKTHPRAKIAGGCCSPCSEGYMQGSLKSMAIQITRITKPEIGLASTSRVLFGESDGSIGHENRPAAIAPPPFIEMASQRGEPPAILNRRGADPVEIHRELMTAAQA